MITNRAASIRARLKQRSDAAREDFNLVLTRFGLERLLYRLSISPYSNQFLLKGALAFSLWFDHPHRPTRDADLLGFGPDDAARLVRVFQAVSKIAVDDGIEFDSSSVQAMEIREEALYGGIRVTLNATLDKAKIKLQVDVGFGDAVTPAAMEHTYPVLLDDLLAPTLRVYPRETVCAEKLEAIVKLGMANSRMKDYFDLVALARENALDRVQLATAIGKTFERRATTLPTELPMGLTLAFAEDSQKQRQWAAFLKRNRLQASPLTEVVREISEFFSPYLIAASSSGNAR
ncbi:MAG TPA: nucleotidyl transferase AbiEii/AbiGii toxin family protein [Steroidobacteraceae bacterium]|nr:nucleotidyl transferase AbiEii/AbiGii toxin family protein [Steroidobacteraceae bacterium]